MLTDMILEPLEVAAFALSLFSGAAFVGLVSAAGFYSGPLMFVATLSLVVLAVVATARRINRARAALAPVREQVARA